MISAILHGIILSAGLILPLGPQNIFIFNQGAMHRTVKKSLPAVITAGICDTILILLAVLGVSLIVMTIPQLQLILYLIGFLFLIYIGYSIWRTDPNKLDEKKAPVKAKKQIFLALSVSLFNPHAIMDTVGVIGTSSLRYDNTPELMAFAISCVVVSWIAFFTLAIMGRYIQSIDKDGKIVRVINKVSALMIWAISILIAYQIYLILL